MTKKNTEHTADAGETPPARSTGYLTLDPEAAKEAYQADLELCQAILIPYDKRVVKDGVVVQESDYARVPHRVKVKDRWITEYVDAPRKSAFRKLARLYNVSTEITEKTKEPHRDGSYSWHYTVKATAPNGVYTEGEGSCTSTEKNNMRQHDVRATAHTRAKSRAISDLIGFGQVSAEEFTGTDEAPTPPRQANTPHPHKKTQSNKEKPQKTGTKNKPRKKGQPEPPTPPCDVYVDNIVSTLEVNGLQVDGVLDIQKTGNQVNIRPPGDIEEDTWESYDSILGHMKGRWNRKQHRWEVTLK